MSRRSRGVIGQGIRVGLYARVSTYDQQTLPMQRAAMRDYAKRRGWTVTIQAQDIGSGVARRPGRERLMLAARRREIDLILVWKLDRWGRSLADLVMSVQELLAFGVGFVSVTEALDFTTPSGRAMAGMLAVFAEFERDMLRDRVRAGIADARKRGKRHGRPPTARAHQATIIRLFRSGMSKRKIAATLGIGRTSVRRLVTDEPSPQDNSTLRDPKAFRAVKGSAESQPSTTRSSR